MTVRWAECVKWKNWFMDAEKYDCIGIYDGFEKYGIDLRKLVGIEDKIKYNAENVNVLDNEIGQIFLHIIEEHHLDSFVEELVHFVIQSRKDVFGMLTEIQGDLVNSTTEDYEQAKEKALEMVCIAECIEKIYSQMLKSFENMLSFVESVKKMTKDI